MGKPVFGTALIDANVRKFSLADIVDSNSWFVPVGDGSIAIVHWVNKPVDGDLFYIKWQGECLFRRITRTNLQITLISKTRKTVIPKDTENELEIIGRVMFIISFPNSVNANIVKVLNKLIK